MAGIFNKVYMKIATIEIAVSGVSAAGIYPPNTHRFNAEDFAPIADFSQESACIIHNAKAVVKAQHMANVAAPYFSKKPGQQGHKQMCMLQKFVPFQLYISA
jgi:hypothetical protein